MYCSETVTWISIALFHARSSPDSPARYPMLNIFSPSGPGSLWELVTLTNLNRGDELVLYKYFVSYYWVIHTWTERRRMSQWPSCPPRSTPWLASHNKRIQRRVLLQWSRSVWLQPRAESWLPSAGTWRRSGDWKLNQTVCFWPACNSELGWELSESGRGDTPGGTSSYFIWMLIQGQGTGVISPGFADCMNNAELWLILFIDNLLLSVSEPLEGYFRLNDACNIIFKGER